MNPDEERSAEALQLERIHGGGALAWVAERAALERIGDAIEVVRMREIRTRRHTRRRNARTGPGSSTATPARHGGSRLLR